MIFARKKIINNTLAKVFTYFSVKKRNNNYRSDVHFNTPKGIIRKKSPNIIPYLFIKNTCFKFDGIINNCVYQKKRNYYGEIDYCLINNLFNETFLEK